MPDDSQLVLNLDADDAPAVHRTQVRISSRVRHLQIKVSPWKGVEVIAPPRCSQRAIQQFVFEHRDWIETAWRKLEDEYPDAGRWQVPDEIVMPTDGPAWQVVRDPSVRRLVERAGTLLLPAALDERDMVLMLQRWVRRRATVALPARLRTLADYSALHPADVVVRAQQTRWGSCSSSGRVSLNFRLMFLDAAMIDCVILHELCHLKHLNHSARFWRLLDQFVPEARKQDAKLNDAWKMVPAWSVIR